MQDLEKEVKQAIEAILDGTSDYGIGVNNLDILKTFIKIATDMIEQ